MKKYIIIMIVAFVCGCEVNTIELTPSCVEKYIDITQHFATKEFEQVKYFIIENAEKNGTCIYYDSINTVCLRPAIDKDNPDYDPESYYNKIYMSNYKWNTEWGYNKRHRYYLLIVREGDLSDSTLYYTVPEGMRENKVYIVNYYHENVDTIKTDVLNCIDKIKLAMKDK